MWKGDIEKSMGTRMMTSKDAKTLINDVGDDDIDSFIPYNISPPTKKINLTNNSVTNVLNVTLLFFMSMNLLCKMTWGDYG